jgi:hypothetical protein
VALDIAGEIAESAAPGARASAAKVENLGPDGAFLRTEAASRLEPGARVLLRFSIDSHPIPFELEAEVRWVRPGTDGGVGLHFVSIAPYDRSALDDYCQRRIDEARGGEASGLAD